MNNYNPVVEDIKNTDLNFPPSMAPIIFESKGSKLLGTMFISNGEGPHPLVILLHGFPGNEVNFDIAHSLRRMNYNVLVFHYRGGWGSQGKFSFSNCYEDIISSINIFESEEICNKLRVDKNRIILAGHSMGSFGALYTAAKLPQIKTAISFGGFNFGFFAKHIKNRVDLIEPTLSGLDDGSLILNCESGKSLLDEMLHNKEEWDLQNYAEILSKKNILIIGAEYDQIAPIELHFHPTINSISNFKPECFESVLIKTGHSFSDKRIKLSETICDWLANR